MKLGLQDNVIPTAMRTGLDNDVYIFSALKTHAQLYEASRLLTDANGKVKSFEIFANDVKKLNVQHNEQYLEAEYRFAVSSATMAGRWAAIEADGDAFNLQYRTAGDDRVRDSHAAIDLVTLPPSDPFWSSYFPPNGWRCFEPSTLILTEHGWRQIQHLKRTDLVIGGSGNMRFVGDVIINEFNGKLITIFSKRKFLSCTPNHRFMTYRGWVEAEFIQTGDIIIQVGKVGFIGKFMNAISNSITLIKCFFMSFNRQRKTTL